MDPIIVDTILPATLDLGDRFVKLFRAVKKELWGSDQEAFVRLRDVIDEIMKFYLATNKEISDFISLDFSSPKNSPENMRALYSIMSGALKVRIQDAKGHCSRIGRIYERHLDKWLREKLKQDDYNAIKFLFQELSVYDYDMLAAAQSLELDLQSKSQRLLALINSNRYNEISTFQTQIRQQFLPEAQKLSAVMNELVMLRNEFMEVAQYD